MEENSKISEENIEDSTNKEPDTLDESNSSIESEKINQKPKIMEVHHHPDLHHKPKKWKEYFLEFIMIFLAVSMGFIAENIRESILNKEKELNYLENLVWDLKGQQKHITEIIKKNEQMLINLDTLVKIRALDFNIKSNNALFFKLFATSKLWDPGIFKINEITLTQIKSTGELSIIRPKIANLIAELDMSNQNIKWGEQYPVKHGEETLRLLYELTDYPSVWDKSYNLSTNLPPLLTDDKKKLMKLFNLYADFGYTIEGYNNNLKNHMIFIDKLILDFEKEYDLKD